MYALTSEPQRLASLAQDKWEIGFEAIGDPHHEISGACRERGLLELFVNTKTDLMRLDEARSFSHPKGYFQPGVLSLDSSGRVLYRCGSSGCPRGLAGGDVSRDTGTRSQ